MLVYNPRCEEITVIGFDRDGTLIDNISNKAKAFADAVIEFYHLPRELKKDLISIYIKTRGISRFDQLEIVRQKYNLKELDKEEKERWSDRFEEIYFSQKQKLFPDVKPTLTALRIKGYKLFMSTSASEEDVKRTDKETKLSGYFDRMFGTKPGFGKPEHLQYIAKLFRVGPERIAFVGDGKNDVEIAKDFGALAIAICRQHEKIDADINIHSLTELIEIF